MANGSWYGTVSDDLTGAAIRNAQITVTDPDSGDLVALYADRDSIEPIGNPFMTRADGLIKFYCRAGRVNINAFRDGFESNFENEVIVAAVPGTEVCVDTFATPELIQTAQTAQGTEITFDNPIEEGSTTFILVASPHGGEADGGIAGFHRMDLTQLASNLAGTTLMFFYKQAGPAESQTYDIDADFPDDCYVNAQNWRAVTGDLDCLFATSTGQNVGIGGSPEVNFSPLDDGRRLVFTISTSTLPDYDLATVTDGLGVGPGGLGWGTNDPDNPGPTRGNWGNGTQGNVPGSVIFDNSEGADAGSGFVISMRVEEFVPVDDRLDHITARTLVVGQGTDGLIALHGFRQSTFGALDPDNLLFASTPAAGLFSVFELQWNSDSLELTLTLNGNIDTTGSPIAGDSLTSFIVNGHDYMEFGYDFFDGTNSWVFFDVDYSSWSIDDEIPISITLFC